MTTWDEMLFITYWELNENMPDEERLGIAQKLISTGMFPPEGVKILRWDGTPDLWGIVLWEGDNAADIFRALNMWRAAGAGFFKSTRTSPVLPVEEIIPIAAELQARLASG